MCGSETTRGLLRKRFIGERIGYDKDIGLHNRSGAKSDVTRGLLGVDAYVRLKPLTVLVDKRDEGDRRLANVRRQQGEVVERLLRVGVEDGVLFEGSDAGFFVGCLAMTMSHLLGKTRSGVHPGRGEIIPQIGRHGGSFSAATSLPESASLRTRSWPFE